MKNIKTQDLPVVKCIARARIPTIHGLDIFLHIYSNELDNKEHLAIVFGEDIRSRSLFKHHKDETQQDRMTRGAYVGRLYPGRIMADIDDRLKMQLLFDADGELIVQDHTTWTNNQTLVRIHSECYTGETTWSVRCDCGEQFNRAGQLISLEREGDIIGGNGHGVIVYLRQEGRGIGLGEKLKAYNLQDLGADTVQANLLLNHPVDSRDFSLAKAIFVDLGLDQIRVLTNNPNKVQQIEHLSYLRCVERVPMVPLSWTNQSKGVHSTEINMYLQTKIERMGHLLKFPLTLHNGSDLSTVST